jgi:hypothetical protein
MEGLTGNAVAIRHGWRIPFIKMLISHFWLCHFHAAIKESFLAVLVT